MLAGLAREPSKQEGGERLVYLAEEVVTTDGEFFPSGQLSSTDNAAEAVDVVDVVADTHHQIGLAKRQVALGTLGAEQSARQK